MKDYLTKLTTYYNKFNEEKRLSTRHGQVEYLTTMKYIHEYLKRGDKVLDDGAGTGRYSIALFEEGYDIEAIELTKPNLGQLKAKCKEIKAYQGNALDLSRYKDESFDVVIMFGPMYHLETHEEKLQALKEAKRVLKKNGYLFVTYILTDYAIIYHGFIENYYKQEKDKIDENYNINDPDNLFYEVRLDEIDKLNKEADLELIKRFASDGPTDYIRPVVNAMDEETFEGYLKYHQANCERKELLGASSHVVDILKK